MPARLVPKLRRDGPLSRVASDGQPRLLHRPRGCPGRQRGRDQEVLPQAGHEASSRPRYRRQGRRREVQADQRGLRRPQGRPAPRRLRPIRPRRLRGGRSRHIRRRRLRGRLHVGLRRHFRRDVRRFRQPPGRRPARPRRSVARFRPALQHGNLPCRRLQGREGEHPRSHLGAVRVVQGYRLGGRRGAGNVSDLSRQRPGARPIRVLHRRAHLPVLPGRRTGDPRSVQDLRRQRPGA